LKQEREERNKSLQELEELRKFKQELEEKEKKKKGQYEELLVEKDNMIQSLSEKAKLYDEFLETKQKQITSELEGLMAKLTPDQLQEHSIFLEDLKPEKQIAYLKKITDEKKQDFSQNPKTEGKDINNELNKSKFK
jgi:hypothetical protein